MNPFLLKIQINENMEVNFDAKTAILEKTYFKISNNFIYMYWEEKTVGNNKINQKIK